MPPSGPYIERELQATTSARWSEVTNAHQFRSLPTTSARIHPRKTEYIRLRHCPKPSKNLLAGVESHRLTPVSVLTLRPYGRYPSTRRHNYGRQRTMGRAQRPSTDRWPPPGCGKRSSSDARRTSAWGRTAHTLCVQRGKLGTPHGRSCSANAATTRVSGR